jgi:hypothetical protein
MSQVPIRSASTTSAASSHELTNNNEAIRVKKITGFTNNFFMALDFRITLFYVI